MSTSRLIYPGVSFNTSALKGADVLHVLPEGGISAVKTLSLLDCLYR